MEFCVLCWVYFELVKMYFIDVKKLCVLFVVDYVFLDILKLFDVVFMGYLSF